MKKLLFSLLFAASVAQAASPFYTPNYALSNGYPLISLGDGKVGVTNNPAFLALIGAGTGGSSLNLDATQLATNASGVLHIISGNVETNSLFYSGSSGAGKLSLDIQNRAVYDASELISFNWQSRVGYDTSGLESMKWDIRRLTDTAEQSSIEWQTRVALDASEINSVDWDSRLLSDSSAEDSLSWESRIGYDDNGVESYNWNERSLIDSTDQQSMDWQTRTGLDSAGQTSFNWEGRALTDAALVTSVNWKDRILFNGAGGTNVDWSNSYLKDTANQRSIDYANRLLLNSSGGTNIDYRNSYLKDTSNQRSVDYANRLLLNSSGGTNVDWLNSYLKDTSNQRSVEYDTRKLKDSGGTEVFDWQNRVIYGGWKVLTNFGVFGVDQLIYGTTNVFGLGGMRTYQGFRYGTNDYIYGGTNLAYNTWTITDQGKFTTSTSMTATQGFSGNGVHFMIPPTNTPADGDFVIATGTGGATAYSTSARTVTNALVFNFDGGGAVIPTSSISIGSSDKAGTIIGWEIVARGTSPTCTFDVWKTNAASTSLPIVGGTIMGTKPALSTGNRVRSTTLTSWQTGILAGDLFTANLDAVTVATNIVFKVIYTTTQ